MKRTITFIIDGWPVDITFTNQNMVTSNSLNSLRLAQTEAQFLEAMTTYESSEPNRTLKTQISDKNNC